VIIGEKEQELQRHLDNLNRINEEYSMRINTGTMYSNIQIGNEKLKNMSEFNYLRSVILSNGKMSTEIDNRCNKASKILGNLTPILKNKHVNLDTKRTLYNIIFIPSLCYHCQTWTLTAQENRKIIATEMRCLRRILNITRRDRIRNDEIRRRVGVIPTLD
jgi:Pyruvate/2-oxoacid:ferredoxin oxidoreductase gamma subunit